MSDSNPIRVFDRFNVLFRRTPSSNEVRLGKSEEAARIDRALASLASEFSVKARTKTATAAKPAPTKFRIVASDRPWSAPKTTKRSGR